ncbi:hypothetical protein J6590_105337, partial [Homalodisca vitripennis]
KGILFCALRTFHSFPNDNRRFLVVLKECLVKSSNEFSSAVVTFDSHAKVSGFYPDDASRYFREECMCLIKTFCQKCVRMWYGEAQVSLQTTAATRVSQFCDPDTDSIQRPDAGSVLISRVYPVIARSGRSCRVAAVLPLSLSRSNMSRDSSTST